MEKKQKIQLGIFGLILISIFFSWLNLELYGKDVSISAMQLMKMASYWPFYLIPISAIAGIYFTIKPNGAYVFIASVVCLLVAIEFYFMLIPITNFGFEANEEFLNLFKKGITFGFYFFALISLVAVIYTYKDADLNKLLNQINQKKVVNNPVGDLNADTPASVYKKPTIKFKITKKQKKVALFSVIGIGLAIGIYFLIPANKELKVGNQIWYFKDLDVTSFRDGEVIPEAKSGEEYSKYDHASKPAWCYVDFDAKNKMYGKLYNRYVVYQLLNKKKKIGDEGWEIPDMADFKELNNYLGQNKENRDIETVALEKIKTTFNSKDGCVTYSTPDAGISYWCFTNDRVSNIMYDDNKIDEDESIYYDARLIRLIKKPLKPTSTTTAVEPKQATTNTDTQKNKTDTPLAKQSVDTTPVIEPTSNNTNNVQKPMETFPILGIINTDKANFFENADSATIRKGYVMKGQEVSIDKVSGNFYSVTYTAPNGKATKGWLAKSAIIKK